MKKRFLVILLVLLSVSVFAKEDYDTATLQFIEDIFNKQIPCTENSFYDNGFVKDLYGDFVTTWEGLQVRAIIEDNQLLRFDFDTSDKQKYVEAWKKALSYAQSKKCKAEDCQIVTMFGLQKARCYTFNHVDLVNHYPSDTKFVISKSY